MMLRDPTGVQGSKLLRAAAKPSHSSRPLSKGPSTTTWFWNLHADAHKFDSLRPLHLDRTCGWQSTQAAPVGSQQQRSQWHVPGKARGKQKRGPAIGHHTDSVHDQEMERCDWRQTQSLQRRQQPPPSNPRVPPAHSREDSE